MAVDFSFAIGYGVVIDQEKFGMIENIIDDIDDRDSWCDRWAQCLNCWNGDEYFVGITHTAVDFDETVAPFDPNKCVLDPEDEQAFLNFYNKYHLEKFFEWTPNCCAIAFIW